MTEFEDASFSVRDWINDACRKKPTGEALDKYLTQLETKLQLKCEEVEKEIETCAIQLAREIPQVLTSASQIKNEVVQLQDTVSETASLLKTRSLAAKSVVGGIHEIHQIKSNMQSACNSLREAAELSELFVRVDAVFNTGDIFAMAKIMTTIHHSLKLVGNVPEFESGKRKMKMLEETLIGSIKTQLLSAMSQRQDEVVVKLSETLVNLDALSTIKESFLSIKRKELEPQIKRLSDTLSDPVVTELRVRESVREWHHLILRQINEEIEWCVRLFPTHGLDLILSLLLDSIERLNNSMNETLMKFASIELTTSVLKTSLEFLIAINEVLSSSSFENNNIKKLTLEPIENQVEKSVQIERSNLNRLINQLDLTSQDIDKVVESMNSALKMVFQYVEMSIDRSVELTGGTELVKLTMEIEFCLTKFVSLMTTSLREIRSIVLPTTLSATPLDDGNNISILQLLKIGLNLSESLSSLQEKLRIASIQVLIELSHDREQLDVFKIAQERLGSSDGNTKNELLKVLKDQDWIQLEGAHRSVDGFRAATEALVFDVFMQNPRSLFKGFASMTEWSKIQGNTQDSLSLPQFSAYPLPYVTSFGEYLMMVPQQLESMVSSDLSLEDERLEKEEEIASGLLTKIINGATELFADEILAIVHLSPLGATQLSCDLQYFSNVLSAMGSAFPMPLASVYEAIKTPNDELGRRIVEDKIESNQLFIFKTIEKMKTTK